MTSDSVSLAARQDDDEGEGVIRLTAETPVVREIAHAMADADAAHRRLRSVFASSVGLSPLEFNALMRIGESDELTPKALASHLDITTGAVTAMTDRLVGAGLIERTPNPNDRRSLLLSLTKTGSRARETMFGQYYHAIAQALEAAPAIRVVDIVDLMERTAESIADTADVIDGTPSIRRPKTRRTA